MKPKLLLHVCCGPCSTHVVKELKKKYNLALFWFNSNIWPYEEYEKRVSAIREVAELECVPLFEDPFDHESWRFAIKGHETQAEGGTRCSKCFEFNLNRTAEFAAKLGFEYFTTTLTISPHKNAELIFEIGNRVGEKFGVKFLQQDFKKQGGFQHSVDLSKEHGIYRQNYCGCEFSK